MGAQEIIKQTITLYLALTAKYVYPTFLAADATWVEKNLSTVSDL